MVPLGSRYRRFGVGDFGLACRHAGLRSALRDREIRIFRPLVGLRFHKLRLRLLHGDFIIARVEFDEHISRLHGLVLFHMDRFHIAIDPRRDAVEMSVHLSVVGGFVGAGIQPERNSSHKNHAAHDGREQERPAPPLGIAAGLVRIIGFSGGIGRPGRTRLLQLVDGHGYWLLKRSRMIFSAWPIARATLALARLWAFKFAM